MSQYRAFRTYPNSKESAVDEPASHHSSSPECRLEKRSRPIAIKCSGPSQNDVIEDLEASEMKFYENATRRMYHRIIDYRLNSLPFSLASLHLDPFFCKQEGPAVVLPQPLYPDGTSPKGPHDQVLQYHSIATGQHTNDYLGGSPSAFVMVDHMQPLPPPYEGEIFDLEL